MDRLFSNKKINKSRQDINGYGIPCSSCSNECMGGCRTTCSGCSGSCDGTCSGYCNSASAQYCGGTNSW